MKLGILSSSLSSTGGGVSTVIGEHISKLDKDYEIYAYSSLREGVSTEIINSNAKVRLSYSPFRGRLSFYPSAFAKMHKDKVDIFHQHGLWNFSSLCGLYAEAIIRKPIIISPHGMLEPWIMSKGVQSKRVMNKLFQNKNIYASNVLHALTSSEANDIRMYGYKGRIVKIPNGVTLPSKRTKLLTGSTFRLLYLGRINEKKNVIELTLAVKKLILEGLDISLSIYGWGDPVYQRSLISCIDNQKEISFLGPVFGEDKTKAFTSADLFILPSQSEGLPMAVLESWSYGVPTLLSNECNLPEGFERGAAIPIGVDIDSIAAGIKEAYDMSNEKLLHMGDVSYKLATDDFSWNMVIEKMKAVYESILSEQYSSISNYEV